MKTMTAAPTLLTIDQFRDRYADEDGYEYWFGEAIRKPMPTWLHCILQAQLAELLYRLGYFAGSELSLRIDPHWEPRPDVVGALEMEEPYPTKPVEIAIEILSDDRMTTLYAKCRHYATIGVKQVFVFDPQERIAWEWSRASENLERTDELSLGNGSVVRLGDIWAELDRRIGKRPS